MSSIEFLKALLGWIDQVPREAVLPAMPGFDRDEVDALLGRDADPKAQDLDEAIAMASDWVASVPADIKAQLAPVPVQCAR